AKVEDPHSSVSVTDDSTSRSRDDSRKKNKHLRTVFLIRNGEVYKFFISKSEADSTLSPARPTLAVTAPPDEPTTGASDGRPDVIVCEKSERRVQLRPPLSFCSGSTSLSGSEDATSLPLVASRPFAVLLRLRVTQIVAGIVTVLFGTVACLDSTTRSTLGFGIPAGALTVLAAALHMQASRRQFHAALAGSSTLFFGSGGSRQAPLLHVLRPLLPTLACVLASLLLLALACMALGGQDRNLVALGIFQSITALVVLSTEAIVWALRWHWTIKSQY
ncbi:uncharacterized protein LOC111087714, partial [Limulus polyphemus]|uniref:Uncharacterized protein LOC111087714 n=1 Tax=Limulus polyphemus TaxID=6850 RepID=A0ABM1T571_LIMPO